MESERKEGFLIVQISAKTYWGFRHYIPREFSDVMTHNEIIQDTKRKMKEFFQEHNLIELKEGVDRLNLHIHDINETKEYDLVYLCAHCD